jgi:hypothetical protein
MHRLTAGFLLLFAVVGNFVPLTLALSSEAEQAHACCVRKAAHPCHGGVIADASRLVIHDTGCCNRDCCRAVTTAQWAHPRPRPSDLCGRFIRARVPEFQTNPPLAEIFKLQATRAPPYCYLA